MLVLLGRITSTQYIRCGLLLPTSHVAWSVCLSVCLSHGCAVQKRLYQSRCRLTADSCGSKQPDGSQDWMNPSITARVTSWLFGHTGERRKNGWTDRDVIWAADSCRSKKQYIRLDQDQMNPFAAMRGNKSAMQLFAKLINYFGQLLILVLLLLQHA